MYYLNFSFSYIVFGVVMYENKENKTRTSDETEEQKVFCVGALRGQCVL